MFLGRIAIWTLVCVIVLALAAISIVGLFR